jgi:DNA primase
MADEATLRSSGLFSSKEQEDGGHGRLYDRFRKRVVFPIANEGGRVIAFTARLLGTPSEGEKAGPKYINSPETPLYSKGQVLFNLDKAKEAMRQHEFALLVEGQMDCISVFLGGIRNVIATSGTAFTEHQVARLRRVLAKPGAKPQIVANFDPDVAGNSAAAKTIALLTEEGFNIKIAMLDSGLDPDRYIRERGVQAYTQAIRDAVRQSDFLIERAREIFPGSSPERNRQKVNFLLPYIGRVPDMLERSQFQADAAQKLGIDSAVLREELRQAALKRRDRVEARPTTLTEVDLVLLRVLASTDIEGANERYLAARAIQEQPAWFEHLASFPALQVLAVREAKDPMDVVDDPGQKALLAEALFRETRMTVGGALQEVQERSIENRQRELRAQIAEAARRGDDAELAALTQQKLELDQALRGLHRRNGDSV